jgi:hypothetical protein
MAGCAETESGAGVKDGKDSLEYLGLTRKTYIVLTVSNHFHSVVYRDEFYID